MGYVIAAWLVAGLLLGGYAASIRWRRRDAAREAAELAAFERESERSP